MIRGSERNYEDTKDNFANLLFYSNFISGNGISYIRVSVINRQLLFYCAVLGDGRCFIWRIDRENEGAGSVYCDDHCYSSAVPVFLCGDRI